MTNPADRADAPAQRRSGPRKFDRRGLDRRALLAGGGAVAGLGLAGGASLSHSLAFTPAANAAATSFTPIEPSGDTSGATDWNAIQSVLNSGQGAAAWLAGGTFYVNQTLTFTSSQQAIRGQGRRTTTICAAGGFTGTQTGTTTVTSGGTTTTIPTTAVIYTGTGTQFLTVDGLTIQGPSSGSLTQSSSTGQLNGLQQTGGSIRCQFTNLHFLNLNGWPFIFDGAGGNNAGLLVANALADNCFAVCCLQGNVGGYQGSGTMMNVGGVNMVTPAAGTPMHGQPSFLVKDYEDLLAWAATPNVIQGNCASCFFYSIDTGTAIVLQDDGHGSPSDIGLYGGIVEADSGNQSGIQITGGAQQVWIHDLKIAYNTNHGIWVSGTGNQIQIRNCQFQNNGQLASGTTAGSYYDLNWSGSASGLVRDCIFNTTIKPAGTSGVVASVNMAAGTKGVDFAGCQFPQSNVHGTMFTNPPGTIRNCPPYNPVGNVTVSVPASGGSPAALPYDATFYIRANAAASCTATVNGSALTVPEGTILPVFVPAGTAMKLTYSKAPDWAVNGH
jgi:hypothetical protein